MQAENKLELSTLVCMLLSHTDSKFSLSSHGNNLVIRSNESDIQAISELLMIALSNTDNFRYFLPFQICGKPKPTSLTLINKSLVNTPPPENSVEAGMKIFHALFDTAFQNLSFSGFFEEEYSSVKNGELWSQPIEPFLKPIWVLAIKTALATLSELPMDALRAAWNGDATCLKASSSLLTDPVIARGSLHPCLVFINDLDKKNILQTYIVFNFGYLYQLLFLPLFESIKIPIDSEENTHEICIDKDRLRTSLLPLSENGVLLRVFKNKEQAKLHELLNAQYLQKLQLSPQKFKIPIPPSWGDYMPQVLFPLLANEQVIIEKREDELLCFCVLPIDDIPEESFVNQLRMFKGQASKMAADDTTSINTRISEINKILVEIENLKLSRQSEINLVESLKREIQIKYIDKLEMAKSSPQKISLGKSRLRAIQSINQHLKSASTGSLEKSSKSKKSRGHRFSMSK